MSAHYEVTLDFMVTADNTEGARAKVREYLAHATNEQREGFMSTAKVCEVQAQPL